MEAWTQARQTKLGRVTIQIVPIQDLFETKLTFDNLGMDLIFIATETFGDVRCAFHWAYGLKQSINDGFAGFMRVGNDLIGAKPKKGQSPTVLSIQTAIEMIQHDYDNFELGRTSASKGDSITVSQVKASTLSPEDQATLLALMAKAKGRVSNGI